MGGIVGIVLLLLIMNYNHPFTTNARIYFSVTPVLPSVRGRVIEVPAQTSAPLKEGDVLFRLDPKPYEYAVTQKKAALAEAEQNVKQLKASLDQATAGRRPWPQAGVLPVIVHYRIPSARMLPSVIGSPGGCLGFIVRPQTTRVSKNRKVTSKL